MKKLIFLLALVPALALAQLQTFSVNDSSVYTKGSTDLTGSNTLETGVQVPVLRSGNFSMGMNLGYVQNTDNLWKSSSWTSGLNFGYNLNRGWVAYTKTSTNFRGNWYQETGLRMNLVTNEKYSVGVNAGYIFDYPFSRNQTPRWTVGATVSFPVRTLF